MDAKQRMRDEHRAYRRRLRAAGERKRELDEAITAHLRDLVTSTGAVNVAAYHPLASEPGGVGFIPTLVAMSRTVFLPISLAHGELQWAVHTGAERAGAHGITEPSGARFNSNVLRSCDLVVVPALAVDDAGMRLGKGAGYYDRALAALPRSLPTVAVVYSRERVRDVPHEEHDIPVTAVITEAGLTRL